MPAPPAIPPHRERRRALRSALKARSSASASSYASIEGTKVDPSPAASSSRPRRRSRTSSRMWSLEPLRGDHRRLGTASVAGPRAAIDRGLASAAVGEPPHRVAAMGAADKPGEQELGVGATLNSRRPLASLPGLGIGQGLVGFGVDEIAVSNLPEIDPVGEPTPDLRRLPRSPAGSRRPFAHPSRQGRVASDPFAARSNSSVIAGP